MMNIDPRKGSLKPAFTSVLAGNLVTAGLGFLISVLLSRFLSVADFGRINLMFSLVVTFFTIADFGFSNTTIIFYNRFKGKYPENPLYYLNSIYLRFWISVIVISTLIVYFFLRPYFNLNGTESFLILFVFIPFMIFRYLNSCNQAYGYWKQFNIQNIMNKFLQMSSIFLGILFFYRLSGIQDKYEATLSGYALYPVLLIVFSIILNYKYLHFRPLAENRKQVVSDLSKIAVPLGMTNIFVIISMRFGYLATDKLLGSDALGIFSAANTLALVFPLITTSLMNVLLRETATRKQEFLQKIIVNQKKYAPFLLLFLVMSIVLSRFFILLIFGENYAASVNIFRILLIPYIGGIFFTPLQSYFYSHQAKTVMTLQFLQMLIVVAGSIILTRYYQLTGIAFAITLSRIAGWIYISVAAKGILKGMKGVSDNAN
jgi:O-antigen/teichoic acid export membrane protein